jgi:nitrogen regulatory protein PII
MKIITVIAQHVSPQALSAALPSEGIASVTVDQTQSFSHTATAFESYRGRKVARHITTAYRIEIVAEDSAVDRVIEGVAFARGAGLLGDARAWISGEATDLFAAAASAVASA